MRAKQKDFFESERRVSPRRVSHGGSASKGIQKIARPLDRKKPVHIVLKSSVARSKLSLLGAVHRLAIARIIKTRARQFEVTVHGFENMGNHIHIAATFKSRVSFQNFLRTVTALIARQVTGARRGKPFGKKFWDHLAFTRVIAGFRDMRGLKSYFEKNEIERDIHPLARKAIERQEADMRRERRKKSRAAPRLKSKPQA